MTQADSFSRPGQASPHLTASALSFSGGGEMGERIRAFDWASTPPGPVEKWPPSLLTLVATSLRSRFPIVIWWGHEHYTMFYNDAYIPFLGKTKHPGWLGRSGRDCWKEIWPVIGPMLESVFETAQPTWSEDLLLVLDRNLPHEEAYFTFSYSAIPGTVDAVDGIFCACTETTERVIGERRLRTLRDLANSASQAREAAMACEMAARLFDQNTTDLPFTLIYLLDSDRAAARLVAHSGAGTAGLIQASSTVSLSSARDAMPWPFDEVAREGTAVRVSPLPGEWAVMPAGLWPEPADGALVLPLRSPGDNQVTGFLVAGVNPRRPLDESYRDFLQMAAGHVATALANARAYEEEHRRAEALAELDRAKTLFFSNISHEFRTPLTLMLGPLADLLAERESLGDTYRESLELVQRNAFRLLKLVNTLLDFSRIEAGRIQAHYEPTDLAQYTADLASTFRSAIERAGLTLHLTLPEHPVPLFLDRDMWEKIIFNLLSNAFKFTFRGSIEVVLQEWDTDVQVQIRDTGVGIPASALPHIFARFHRVEGTKSRSIEGSGIGLALVQELVRLHEGNIAAASAEGQGTTFTITLPKGNAHLSQDLLHAGSEPAPTALEAAPYLQEMLGWLAESASPVSTAEIMAAEQAADFADRPRIVLADDNTDMREYMKRLLSSHFEVEAVSNGTQALQAIAARTPDLVVTDVMMPEQDGFQLLQVLKTDPETARIPVILVSARAGEEAVIEGVQAGADDYLVKPFSARELLARVTTQIKTTRTRYEAEGQLYGLFEQTPAAVVILRGPAYVVELANPATLRLWGRTREQVLGKPLFEALPEIREQGLKPLLEGVLISGIPYIGHELNVPLDRKGDGQLEDTYFTFVYAPLRDASQAIKGIMVFAYEVTEQVLARRKLEESETSFRALADNIPNLAWMARPDGWIYWYNSRWYDYTGTTPEQMQGWGWQSVHDQQALPSVLERWKHSLASREPFEMVFPLRGANGLFRPFLTRVVPIYDADGHLLHWFGTNTDITEQKRLEQQKDEFLSVASHELKTPVTSLKAYTQLLERRFRQSGDAHSADLLGKMDAQLNKLTGLVEDLLDVSKIENGQLLLQPSSFEMNELIAEVVEETQRAAPGHAIVQELDAPVLLFADRDRIGQVLINLLTNAIKYSPQASTVLVRTRRSEDTLITSVQDFGIGIPGEKLPYLFKRFYRVEGESQITYPGMGLGLYISAEFVKRHRGSIQVESEPDKGTTMSFSLPLPDPPDQASVCFPTM